MNFHRKIFLFLFAFSSIQCLAQTANQGYSLFIGVLGSDGIIIPFANLEDSIWINPWTEPFDSNEQILHPKIDAPKYWHYYDSQRGITIIETEELVLTDAHCLYNWGLTTNWDQQVTKKSYNVRTIVGIVSSELLDFIPQDSLRYYSINDDSVKINLNLLNKNAQSETAKSYEHLGYIKIRNNIFKLIRFVGYEYESYLIFEIKNNNGKMVLKVDGGGC